ncbi:MAG: GatB/YqeY domain-containing protein [Candidatus Nanopelagicales bacterium]
MSPDQIAPLKAQLQSDLTTSIKARDELTSSTLRMVLTALTNEEVAGKEVRVLSDDDVLTVLTREAKKRRESALAYTEAKRPELAERESAELAVITNYLPQQLSESELTAIVSAAVEQVAGTGVTGGAAMGAVMKIVQPQVKGKADGGVVAGLVKKALG